MQLLPRPDVCFLPFSEGAVLFRQTTRQLIVLNRNAAVIWCLLNEVGTLDEVASALQKKSSIDLHKATADAKAAVAFFLDNGLLHDGPAKQNPQSSLDADIPWMPQEANFIPVVSCAYQKIFRVPGLVLEICCQDEEIGGMVDKTMSHLTIGPGSSVEACLQVLPAKKKDYCWDIHVGRNLLFTNVEKGSVLPHLLQLAFDLSCRALSEYFLFHAAVVARKAKACLFPAHVGSGKTTLTALLAKNGFRFFSDELAVIDVETLQVKPFAMPMSIKPGSLAVLAHEYPELESLAAHFRPDGKVVRYLAPPAETLPEVDETATVAALVFPRYLEGGGNRITPLSKEETLQRLVQTCSSDRFLKLQDIKAMLAVVEQAQCLALYYEDTDEAVRLVKDHTSIY